MMAGQDPQALKQMQKTRAIKMAPVADSTTRFATNWSLIAGSLAAWAMKIFPSLDQTEAETRLWDTLFEICRVKSQDPLASWEKHLQDLAARQAYLTAKNYDRLHYRAPGTDLTIGLPDDHLWAGGRVGAQHGIQFVPNLPTEEVATTPHRGRVNGFVSSTKPLSWGGVIIEGFSLTFANGRVVEATAEKGQAALDSILETDEGALYLGEVALVPNSSPISQSGLLFYNTLFDENASCHLALGRAYKYCIRGATTMSDDQFLAVGGNISLTHVDFMVGSANLDVDGYLADGTVEPILRSGEWAYDV
jgi:aminopeptidase